MISTKSAFKILVILLLIITVFQKLEAQKISPEDAKKAANVWFQNIILSDINNLQKVSSENYNKDIIEIRGFPDNETLAFVVEFEPKGFIIISPDLNINPIIGYSGESNFDPNPSYQNTLLHLIRRDLSNRLKALMNGYISEQIKNKAQSDWNRLLKIYNEEIDNLRISDESLWDVKVGPFVLTTWNQGEVNGENVFNLYTPNNWWSGCISTAVAQVLKYYNWPPVGSGSHSYNEDDAGTLSADFGTTTYVWNDMLNSYSVIPTPTQREAVGLLIYHVGVAVEMDYGKEGSSASLSNAANAFSSYFRTSSEYLLSSNSTFYDRLYSNITYSKPVLFNIGGTNLAHAVVVDGVQHNTDDTKYYHLNFGWGGISDAWYDINSNMVTTEGTYDTLYAAIIDIIPNPLFSSAVDTSTTGDYTVSWNVSDKLNAAYFELTEGIQAASISTFIDGAESGTDNWTIDGNWESNTTLNLSGGKSFRGYLSTEAIYETHKITSNKSFYINETTTISYYWKTGDFDVDGVNYAQVRFQVSTDEIDWTTLKTYTQGSSLWALENIDLPEYTGQMIFARFTISHISGSSYYDGSEYDYVGFFVDDFKVDNCNEVIWTTVDDNISANSQSISGKSDGKYYYKVHAYRDSEWWEWSNIYYTIVDKFTNISDIDRIIPKEFRIYQNYPNPFNPETTIKYELPKKLFVTLKIYNILGQEIKNLVSRTQNAGKYSVIWDGTDKNGNFVSSGIYFYSIKAGKYISTKKMLFLK